MSSWDTLDEIAAKEGTSLAKFLNDLHDDVLHHHPEVKNFASLLRCQPYQPMSLAASASSRVH